MFNFCFLCLPPFLLVLQSFRVLVIGCSPDEEEGTGIGSSDIGSEKIYLEQLGTTPRSYELGDCCDKVKMVLIVEAYCGGLGEDKEKFPMSEESYPHTLI